MRAFIFMTTAMPAYWIGLLLMWFVSIKLDLLPTSGNNSLKHLILPALTVSLTYISTYIRLIRNNMLENMKKDYVLYANLPHVFTTLSSLLGLSIGHLLGGTAIIEMIFSYQGLGNMVVEAIRYRDYPIIQAYVLLIGTLFVIFNLIFDILQTIIDPRLRKEVS